MQWFPQVIAATDVANALRAESQDYYRVRPSRKREGELIVLQRLKNCTTSKRAGKEMRKRDINEATTSMNELNPYQQYGSPTYPEPTESSPKLPIYSVIVLIADLFLCGIRGLLGVATLFALLSFEAGSPIFIISALELFAAVGIVFCGVVGNVLTLAKKPIGIPFCWGAVGFTVFSIVVALGVIPFQMEQMQQNPAFTQNPQAARIGMILGAGFTLLIRVGILVAYGVAVRMASRALR